MEPVAAALAAIVLVGIGSQWLAWRLRIPSILLLLIGGFLLGNLTDLLPEDLFGELLFPAVSIAVALILFEGGLGLRYNEFRENGTVVIALVVTGVLVAGPLIAVAAHELVGFPWDVAALVGAIFVVTGPTVVGPLLEHVRPMGRLGPILTWEGIAIDPIGAMLTFLVLEAARAGGAREAIPMVAVGVLRTLGVGVAVGGAAAWLLAVAFRRYLIPDQLHNPFVLMVVVVAFTVANALQAEAGLFAAPMMGLLLANDNALHVRHISEFQEDLRVLLLAGLFIVLGARIGFDDAAHLGWESALLLGALVVVIRPLAVALGTIRSGLGWRERVFLAAVAPRGVVAAAVASLLAIELAEAGHISSDRFLTESFFIVVGTVTVYGLASGRIARALGVGSRARRGVLIIGAYPFACQLATALNGAGYDALLIDTDRTNIRRARMAGLRAERTDAAAESMVERIKREEVGKVFALTSNEDLNLLAVTRYAKVVGRSEVYKIAPKKPREGALGRVFLGPDMTMPELVMRFVGGAKVQVNTMTERFGPAEFERRYGDGAIPAFLVGADGSLQVYTTDERPTPRVGDTLISILEGHAVRTEQRRRLQRKRRRSTPARSVSE